MKEITSKTNETVKELVKLQNSTKLRAEQKCFIVEGEHLIEEAQKHGAKIKEMFIDNRYMEKYPDATIVTNEVGQKITSLKTFSGVLAIIEIQPTDIIGNEKTIILDDIQDPGNIGTIIRNAVAFGYKNIICSNGCVDIYNPKVLRGTQGAIFQVNIKYGELTDMIDSLNHEIISADIDGEKLSSVKTIANPHAVIFGNEGNGISDKLDQFIDRKITIETSNVESLNVGVASGIVMYELNKKN